MKAEAFLQEARDREFDIHLRWIDKDTYGLYSISAKDEITVSLNLALFIAETFIHELLHHRNPDWSEKKVEKGAAKTIDRMTVNEIHELCNKVLEHSQ